MGIFLELLGKCVLLVTVALLMKCESEAAGGHLVTTWDYMLGVSHARSQRPFNMLVSGVGPFHVFSPTQPV